MPRAPPEKYPPAKAGGPITTRRSYQLRTIDRPHARSRRASGAGGYVKLHLIAFVQLLVTLDLDRAVMHEHIRAAVIGRDKAEALDGVEPLHGAALHKFLPTKTPPCGGVSVPALEVRDLAGRMRCNRRSAHPCALVTFVHPWTAKIGRASC